MKDNFRKKVLKNGMTILFEKRSLPIVSVAFAVRCGGINEKENEKGMSHFIEHMLYKGTPTRDNKKIAEEIEKHGGELNGFTSETITAYWCKMPSKHLEIALNVLSDMVKNPLFDEKELEKERKVIFEELKMCRDNPRRYVLDEIHKSLFKKPFGMSLVGTYESMNLIDREKMVKKFEEVYTSNNMILTVIGDADFDKIVKFAEENFSNKKGKVSEVKIQAKNETKIEKRKGIDQANLVFAYHVPILKDKKSSAAKVLSILTVGGMSSRLFNEIRIKRNLAYAVIGDSDISKNFAFNFIYVGTTKENVENVKKIILDEFKKISKDLTEAELNQIKEQMIGNYHLSMEDSQSQMVNLLMEEVEGKAEDFYEFEKNISKVKLEDVKNLADIKDYSFFALVPN